VSVPDPDSNRDGIRKLNLFDLFWMLKASKTGRLKGFLFAPNSIGAKRKLKLLLYGLKLDFLALFCPDSGQNPHKRPFLRAKGPQKRTFKEFSFRPDKSRDGKKT